MLWELRRTVCWTAFHSGCAHDGGQGLLSLHSFVLRYTCATDPRATHDSGGGGEWRAEPDHAHELATSAFYLHEPGSCQISI